ncbi:MAG: TrkH family potassium uptake protein [Lachnospiraceae bacterium]|nr:TrkH family potassium uptake protein [Lachnospiraceae bacterium]
MNKRLILKVLGMIMIIEAALMLLPVIVAVIYREPHWLHFILTAVGLAILGSLLYLIKPKNTLLHARDGFLIVGLAWLVLSAAGAVPFVISGSIPNYLNALMETVSGFTTTGVTILDDIEALSHSMLFWRSFTHWVGGMGILVFMLSITPIAGGGSALYLMKAESPGPITEKVSPKISSTAKWLYVIYFAITGAEVIALCIAKLSLFNSFLISFATMGTGGFSYLNTSLMDMTWAQQTIATVFMLLAGLNFSLYFLIATGKGISAIKDEEFRWYAAIYVIATVVITVNVYMTGKFETLAEAIHHVAFGVASVITTTGFVSCDMDLWPWFSKGLLLLIMFIGACAGSTAGGLKVSRFAIMIKSCRRYLRKMMHPRSVSVLRFNKKELPKDVHHTVMFYIIALVLLTCISMIVVTLDPKSDFTTAFSAVSTTINNNGVAFGGAVGSMSGFAWYSKIIFIIDMLIGRLEIFPIIILFATLVSPFRWISKKIKRRAD